MSEKKWYALYTRPRWEKKVAETLTKKGIANYCPLNRVRKQWADRKKTIFEPIFTSYVFVNVAETEHLILKKTEGVLNLIYWLGKPAVIKDIEIDMIRRFLNEHQNVKLEKATVNLNDMARIISGPLMDHEGRIMGIKNKSVKIILPSLGYMMIAEIETINIEVIEKEYPSKPTVNYQYAVK